MQTAKAAASVIAPSSIAPQVILEEAHSKTNVKVPLPAHTFLLTDPPCIVKTVELGCMLAGQPEQDAFCTRMSRCYTIWQACVRTGTEACMPATAAARPC